jgi:outer membrane protein OmpA-like peptidoglycan-associated protein
VLGAKEFVLDTPSQRLFLRVLSSPQPFPPDQRLLVRRAVFALRAGIDQRNSAVLALVQSLHTAIWGGDSTSTNVSRRRDVARDARVQELSLNRVIAELEAGRIAVRALFQQSLTEPDASAQIELPPLPPPRRESGKLLYEVRFVDEVGQALSGIAVRYEAGSDSSTVISNAAGVALLENVTATSASVLAEEVKALSKIVEPRWKERRRGSPPRESNRTDVVFRGSPLGPVSVKPVVPNLVVVKPPLGCLFAQLFDKSGHISHVECKYEIDGPEAFSGKTDENARLRHDGVLPGDYKLTLTIEPPEGIDEPAQVVEVPLVVLESGAVDPIVRCVGIVPYSVLARLHFFFNTNKAFLLPSAIPGVRLLRKLYLQNSPSELLVVGHADTTASPAYNDELSLERAEATIAYLKDDVDAWLKFYEPSVPAQKRWGKAEDRMLLVSMPDFVCKPKDEDGVRWFQRTRGLQVDGKIGKETRTRLITEYMALDGESLTNLGIEIKATAHGCGENFPVAEDGQALDQAPEDGKRDPGDRRVELFFFDPEFGIAPKPPAKNSAAGSTEYLRWRESVIETHDITPGEFEGPRVAFIEMLDALFRSDSAVVLPEGENPDADGEHQAISTVGLIATALRVNEFSPGKKLLVAGHADTTGDVAHNLKLSAERAKCALALLLGGKEQRDIFAKLCNDRHTVADYKQVLSWASRALELGFDCDPGEVDDNEQTGVEPVKRFQAAYNENREALRVPAAEALEVDGDFGPLTWGAVFDCYEFALAEELGEDDKGVKALRDRLIFVDDDRKSLGFSEHFPVEELGVDHFKSQRNRRVEILFFASGEEPDLAAAEEDPETSELYLPGNYLRFPVEPLGSARAHDLLVPVRIDRTQEPTRGVNLELISDGGLVLRVAHDNPDIEEDEESRFRIYPFRKIPLGRYRLDVVLEDSRSTSLSGLRIKKQGVFIGDTLIAGTGTLEAPEELELLFPPAEDFISDDTLDDA